MPLHLYFENIFWSFFQMHFVLHSSHISDCKLELAIEIMAVATFPLAFHCSFLSSHTPISNYWLCSLCNFINTSHHMWCGFRLVRFVHLCASASVPSSDGFSPWFMLENYIFQSQAHVSIAGAYLPPFRKGKFTECICFLFVCVRETFAMSSPEDSPIKPVPLPASCLGAAHWPCHQQSQQDKSCDISREGVWPDISSHPAPHYRSSSW